MYVFNSKGKNFIEVLRFIYSNKYCFYFLVYICLFIVCSCFFVCMVCNIMVLFMKVSSDSRLSISFRGMFC